MSSRADIQVSKLPIDPFAKAMVLIMFLAIPAHGALTFDGMVSVSPHRWFATIILGCEAIIILLCLLGGWRPVTMLLALPRHVQAGLGIWLAGATVASALAEKSGLSIIFQAMWLLHGTFGLALWHQLMGDWREARRPLMWALTAGLLLHSVIVYVVAIAHGGQNTVPWESYSVGVASPRHYVFYAAAMLGLASGFLVFARSRSEMTAAAIIIFSAYHLFAWSGGRNALGVALMFPLLFVVIFPKRWKLVLIWSYLSALIAFPLTIWTAPPDPIYGFRSIYDRILGYSEEIKFAHGEYSSGRAELWAKSLDKFLDKPIFGHGQFQFNQVNDELINQERKAVELHPHNFVIQFLYDWGIFAIFGIAIAIFPFLISIKSRIYSYPSISLPAFSGLFALALTSLLDGAYFFNLPLFLTASLLAVLASVRPACSSDPRLGQAACKRV